MLKKTETIQHLCKRRVEKVAVSTILKSHILIDRTVKLIVDQTGLQFLMSSRAAMKIMQNYK